MLSAVACFQNQMSHFRWTEGALYQAEIVYFSSVIFII